MSKYFGTPFADSGDKTVIPDAAQAGGEISYAEGYTVDYTLDQASNPSAKDVGRTEFNQLGNDLSGAIKDIQEQGILFYRAVINFTVNAISVGSDGEVYKCLIANGPLSTVVDPVGDVTGTWIDDKVFGASYSVVDYTSAGRVLGATYTSPDYPIYASVSFTCNASTFGGIALVIEGVEVAQSSVANGSVSGAGGNVSYIIPPNSDYAFSLRSLSHVSTAMVRWTELRRV